MTMHDDAPRSGAKAASRIAAFRSQDAACPAWRLYSWDEKLANDATLGRSHVGRWVSRSRIDHGWSAALTLTLTLRARSRIDVTNESPIWVATLVAS